MDKDTQLPAEVLEYIEKEAQRIIGLSDFCSKGDYSLMALRDALTEYATKLHQEQQDHEETRQSFKRQLNNRLSDLQAKCERYETALMDIASGKVLPQLIAQQALFAGEGEKEKPPPAPPDYGVCQRCNQERATTRYSDLYVCGLCDKILNDEFDEEYR